MPVNGILLLCLGWCPYLLLGIVRQATKTNMQDCWSFTCCFSQTLGSSSKCGQLKSSIGITLVDVLQNWFNWFHFLFLKGGRLVILIDCKIFLPPFLDAEGVCVNSFFPRTATLWNSLPIECFPLTYDLSYFKSKLTNIF